LEAVLVGVWVERMWMRGWGIGRKEGRRRGEGDGGRGTDRFKMKRWWTVL